MTFLDLAKRRYSVRQYQKKPVEPEKLARILEAGHVAPSAANLQPVKVIAVQSEAGLGKLGKAAELYHAPLALLVCADRSRAWKRPFDGKLHGDIDAAIVTDHMMLEATELGLGSVWICRFKPDVVREAFALPEHLEPVDLLAIGYADGTPADPDRHASTRKAMDEFVSSETV